ncbi:hypothetical protein ACPRNU_13530 [Chromobacterium vaccinii]|uniref:hypothetical protein n=1 Tax=Chromobacterium TaxID=535 RepID=UPI0013052E8E|nr:hypothetical protein [Chromobacterium sp. ATCC 53434]
MKIIMAFLSFYAVFFVCDYFLMSRLECVGNFRDMKFDAVYQSEPVYLSGRFYFNEVVGRLIFYGESNNGDRVRRDIVFDTSINIFGRISTVRIKNIETIESNSGGSLPDHYYFAPKQTVSVGIDRFPDDVYLIKMHDRVRFFAQCQRI